ncbi:Meiosis initiator protein [Vulpes lagopus]
MPGCPHQNQLSAQTRRQRKNHTSKLHELALLLPVALKTGIKKLTKICKPWDEKTEAQKAKMKEILLHVLHYIQYLQRSIDVAKALLKFHTTNGEGGRGGCAGRNSASGPMRRRHSTPSSSPHSRKSRLQGACRKPRKKKLTGLSEHQTRAQNPRRSLALDKPKKWMTLSPEQQGRNAVGTATPSRCAGSCCHPKVASSLPQDAAAVAESVARVMASIVPSRPSKGPKGSIFSTGPSPIPEQKLVFYDSSEELDKDSPDADPWLPAWTPEGSPHAPGSLLDLGPPQIANWSVTGHPSEILGFSPSLFSSPGKLPPEQILEDSTEFLTQALFEEVWLDPMPSLSDSMLEALQNKEMPSEAPEDAPDPHGLCQSSVSLDHCYLSLSENSKVPSSSSSEDTDTESGWKQQEDTQADPEGLPSSSDEDGDCTWTPTRRTTTLPTAGRKAKKGRAGRGPTKPKENKKAPCQPQMKKKCVNGFIMFCRMNRKQYIRACPGTASTAATKELAQLWRVMTQQERRPYCIKARRFSLQHNRIVKQDSSSSEDEDWGTPKPFYQLLAEKARRSPDLASQLPPQHY